MESTSRILSLMSHSYGILVVLLLLISTTLVQTKIVDIPYTDERVILTPKTGWYANNSCKLERMKFHSIPGVTGLIKGFRLQNVQVYGQVCPTKVAQSVSILQGTEFVDYDRKSKFDSVELFRVGIAVYGYAEPQVGRWKFQIDAEPPGVLSFEANTTCKIIKDYQGLLNEKHLVTVTPLANSFVLTKFRYIYSTCCLSRVGS